MSAHELVLSASGLSKEYGHGAALVHAVRDVTLEVGEGESIAIVGPSGCGKSSLLYLLGGLERPTAGTLRLAGAQLEHRSEAGLARLRRHALGFVFQDFHLVLHVIAQQHAPTSFFLSAAGTGTANHVLVLLSVIMVILAAASATFTAWATVIDARNARPHSRALSAPPPARSPRVLRARSCCLGWSPPARGSPPGSSSTSWPGGTSPKQAHPSYGCWQSYPAH